MTNLQPVKCSKQHFPEGGSLESPPLKYFEGEEREDTQVMEKHHLGCLEYALCFGQVYMFWVWEWREEPGITQGYIFQQCIGEKG